MTEDLERWRAWLGHREATADTLDLNRARALQATLDSGDPPLQAGDPLPPLWHWLYFWTVAPASAIGPDGHAERGGFLPPIELPRRMWAGSRLSFPAPLPLGAEVRRESEITAVDFKEGRSGPLAFVTVRHRVSAADTLAIEEEHDIAYRAAARPGEAPRPGSPAPADPPWRREIRPDPVLLFRYSALTFNGHRIHYDQPYVTGVEGYPGLIVHGPLLATLMVELARRAAGRPVASFRFRALRPIFDTASFTVAGVPEGEADAKVWVADPEGLLAMDGQVGFG